MIAIIVFGGVLLVAAGFFMKWYNSPMAVRRREIESEMEAENNYLRAERAELMVKPNMMESFLVNPLIVQKELTRAENSNKEDEVKELYGELETLDERIHAMRYDYQQLSEGKIPEKYKLRSKKMDQPLVSIVSPRLIFYAYMVTLSLLLTNKKKPIIPE